MVGQAVLVLLFKYYMHLQSACNIKPFKPEILICIFKLFPIHCSQKQASHLRYNYCFKCSSMKTQTKLFVLAEGYHTSESSPSFGKEKSTQKEDFIGICQQHKKQQK